MSIEEIQEVLQAFKEGKPLQYKGITSKWEDSNMNLTSLLTWLSHGKMIRIAPPKPRSIWANEYKNWDNSATYLSNTIYLSESDALREVTPTNPKFVRSVEFVEKMD